MQREGLRLEEAVEVLERTPASLNALLSGLSEKWVGATEGEATWSPREVIGHLIHAERVNWLPRVRHIMAGEVRPFDPFDRYAHLREPRSIVSDLLSDFAVVRRESLTELEQMRLESTDFPRTGLHPELGEVTLGQLLATWVVHDLTHVTQVTRTMAKAYSKEVGPWRQYLSVLQD